MARHEGLLAALFGSDGSSVLKVGVKGAVSLKVLDPMRRARNLALALSRGRLGSEL